MKFEAQKQREKKDFAVKGRRCYMRDITVLHIQITHDAAARYTTERAEDSVTLGSPERRALGRRNPRMAPQ